MSETAALEWLRSVAVTCPSFAFRRRLVVRHARDFHRFSVVGDSGTLAYRALSSARAGLTDREREP